VGCLDFALLLNEFRPLKVEFSLVRVGPAGDGGYLLPDDLQGIGKNVSPGCNLQIDFELSLWEKYQIPSLIVDTVEKLPHNQIDGIEKCAAWLGTQADASKVTLNDLIKMCNIEPQSDLLLQMDIEGAEYFPILSTDSKDLQRFRIIIIEFHRLADIVTSSDFLDIVQNTIRKLKATHYVAHFHPNNAGKFFSVGDEYFPDVAEVTFHRLDRVSGNFTSRAIPDKLDEENSVVQNRNEFSFIFKY